MTGNPVRLEVTQIEGKRSEAFAFYGLDASRPTLLVIGGSLGARTLNESLIAGIEQLQQAGIQVLWQCGKLYYEELISRLKGKDLTGIHLTQFIARMDLAYALADVIVSRAGAISVSELCLIQKPAILVPSPNVAEDHQTHNAMALVNKQAAVLVKDTDARTTLINEVIQLMNNKEVQTTLAANIAQLGKPGATKAIVSEITKIG